MLKEIESIEDIRKYVETHNNSMSLAWADMLFDMDEFGQEYTLEEFIEEADMQIIKGHISFVDYLAIEAELIKNYSESGEENEEKEQSLGRDEHLPMSCNCGRRVQ